MAVTLRTVAEAAGVSISTASRALAGSPRISEATRVKVGQAADRLGYRPNHAATSLRSRHSHLVGLVLNNLMNQSFHTIAEVIQRELAGVGYHLILTITDGDPRTEDNLLLALADHGVDGVILIGSGQTAATTNRFLRNDIAIVNVIRSSRASLAPTVLAADRDGASEATDHLLNLGHRKIGYIGGLESTDSGRERHAGYRESLQRRRISYDESLIERGPFTKEFGAAAAAKLLTRVGKGMTALFVANHEAMFGVLPVLAASAIKVPAELSVVSFEDMAMLQMWHPPITVVEGGATEIAKLATSLLLDQIGTIEKTGSTPERLRQLTRTYRVGAQLLVRGSTRTIAPK
ncbi:MAG: LacI family DNA-binding transcriptional regulator [Gordonia sp. (in: high G+C Gram-positive bacteria)]